MPAISIVVLLVEHADLIKECMTYYARRPTFNNENIEFVFVSFDCTESFLHDYFYPHYWAFENRASFLKLPAATPAEEGLEKAIDTCDGEFVQVISAAMLLHEGWLAWAVEQFECLDIGALEPSHINPSKVDSGAAPVRNKPAFPFFEREAGIVEPYAVDTSIYGYTLCGKLDEE